MTKLLILCLVFLSSPVFANPIYLLTGSIGVTSGESSICDVDSNSVNDYLFCTGWEEGAGILNTGASIEDVFDSSSGSAISRTTGTLEDQYVLNATTVATSYVESNNGGSGYSLNTGDIRVLFKYTGAQTLQQTENLVVVYDSSSATIGTIAWVQSGGNHFLRGFAYTTAQTLTQLGTDFQITIDTNYEIVWNYSNTSAAGQASFKVYNSSGVEVYNSGNITVTQTNQVNRFRVGKNNGRTGTFDIDGVTLHNSTIIRYYQ